MTKTEINEQIAKLQAQRAEIERKEHEQAEAERKKREEEKEKELVDIKNAIKAFNEKHDEHYSLTESIDDFAIEYRGEPIDKIISEYFDSLLR